MKFAQSRTLRVVVWIPLCSRPKREGRAPVPADGSPGGKGDGRLRHHPDQVLAGRQHGRADRRLEARIDDPWKIWKLSPMDLESYSRWFDYSRARDEMFKATDTDFAPWTVARSNDKRRARLNIINDLLTRIPYKKTPRPKVKLPKRQKRGGYRDPGYDYRYVEDKY